MLTTSCFISLTLTQTSLQITQDKKSS